jgi:hypothetical protein
MVIVLSAQIMLYLVALDQSVNVYLDSSFPILLVNLVDLELPLAYLTPVPSLVYQVMDYLPLELVSNVL